MTVSRFTIEGLLARFTYDGDLYVAKTKGSTEEHKISSRYAYLNFAAKTPLKSL